MSIWKLRLKEEINSRFPPKPFTSDRIILAYLAGYFDGEGCITMMRNMNISYPSVTAGQLRITVVSYDKESIEMFSLAFGGRSTCTYQNGRRYFRWSTSGGKAQKVMFHLIPFLVSKKDQAIEIQKMTFLSRNGGQQLSRKEIDIRKEVSENIRIMKKKHKSL